MPKEAAGIIKSFMFSGQLKSYMLLSSNWIDLSQILNNSRELHYIVLQYTIVYYNVPCTLENAHNRTIEGLNNWHL